VSALAWVRFDGLGSGAGVERRPGGPKAVGFQIYGRNFTIYVATLVGLGLVRESC